MLLHRRKNQDETPPRSVEDLVALYPELFRGPHVSLGCGAGWVPLLHKLTRRIHHVLGRYREVKEIRQDFQKRQAEGKEPAGPEPSYMSWIDEYFASHPEDPLDHFNVVQIKEKFGGLRYYWDYTGKADHFATEISRINGIVEMAESMSWTLCEDCGTNQQVDTAPVGGWIKTLCPGCRQSAVKARAEWYKKHNITDE